MHLNYVFIGESTTYKVFSDKPTYYTYNEFSK